MTKPRTFGSITSAPAQSRNGSSLQRRSSAAMVGIVVLFCLSAVIASPAQSIFFTTLASFNGTDGSQPYVMSLVQGTDGSFYGTTQWGGTGYSCGVQLGCGTVFKITPAGVLTTLHNFCPQTGCTDGSGPPAGLVQGTDGNFYGTTPSGGATGNGTVFKITPAGALTTLYSFCSQPNCVDGWFPKAALVQGTDGNFYGTTFEGGTGYQCGGGVTCGTVFKITPAGTLTTLWSFCPYDGCYPDGGFPEAPLVQASDGNFYGTTSFGGAYGNGTIFKITPTGTLTPVYSFCYYPGCGYSASALVQATDGNFYGTTQFGGTGSSCQFGCGTVFQMTPSGTLTTLHSFDGPDGSGPVAGLVQASDGNLYGTTAAGGANNDGTAFKITLAGTLTTLHSFDGTDGSVIYGGLVQAVNGFFYGTTAAGGAYDYGTVFRLLPVRQCATCRP